MDAFVYKLFKILIYEPLILALTYVAKTTCIGSRPYISGNSKIFGSYTETNKKLLITHQKVY